MNKTKQIFASLILMVLAFGTAFAEECPVNRQEGNVCLPEGFPVETIPSNYPLNLMEGVTKVSHEVFDLHMLILWICVFIGILVFGAMFYSIYHHRKSKGHEAAHFHDNIKIEILWTIVPFLILVAMAIPSTKVLYDLNKSPEVDSSKNAQFLCDKTPEKCRDFDLTIKVTGHQWYWEYEILDNKVHFESHLDDVSQKVHRTGSTDPRSVSHYLLSVDKPLVVPVGKKIRFVFTSADVIHSWWIPDLGWKKDANPGFINEAWTYVKEPGIFRGQCTELCGRDHGFMPAVVIAMNQEGYDDWVKQTLAKQNKETDLSDQSHDLLMVHGESQYLKNCVSCHQLDGQGIKGSYPALKNIASAGAESVASYVMMDRSKNSYTNKLTMPSFAKLKADELAQISTYVKSSFGESKDGTDLQPKKADEIIHPENKTPDNNLDTSTELKHEELVSGGKSVYESKCVFCHGAEGKNGSAPALAGSSVVNGDIKAETNVVLNGKGSGMPSFAKSLNAVELAKVITFTRNSFGNSKGDHIQPKAAAELMGTGSNTAPVKELAPAKTEKKEEKPKESVSSKETVPLKGEISDGNKPATTDKPKAPTTKPDAALIAKGKSVYGSCAACHGEEGKGGMGPALSGSPVVKGDINDEIKLLLNGKGMMPALGKTLSAEDFAAVVTYTRNALGNSVGDSVQPSAIEALKAEKPAKKPVEDE